ncbi:unnamed protein product [Psylliodes chrysocephalus]|uniref:Serine aminopeptidase S33 domain-containing protein n=1 Tax=Psylliodes chrysocephalus TaxID=3402493 RepID=A0A9P0GEV0_9CUCU|nr:unnamed protein product [Psylliodes chrysocephala]
MSSSKQNKHRRYHDYYLINDNEMGEVDFDLPIPQEKRSRCICYTITILCILFFIFFIVTYVVLPLIFMNSKTLQSALIFTRFGLHNEEKYFKTQRLPAYKNRYVTLENTRNNQEETLGLWHILPDDLAYKTIYDKPVDFDQALLHSQYSVLIYFHGTGEDRADNRYKYRIFTPFFHVIAFDYRGYGDSSSGEISEENVVNDCIELYKWVRNKTTSDVYVWGHSLGAAIAADTVAKFENEYKIKTKGLVLESAFTNLHDELYVHPLTKLLSWVPWFTATVVDPLTKNGFLFETDKHISTITCPMMILHAEDDDEIPVKFGRKLYEIASARNISTTIYHEFAKKEERGHVGIYDDTYMNLYVKNFLEVVNTTVG